MDNTVSLRCFFPDGLLPALVGSESLRGVDAHQLHAAARGVLDFLIDQGSTVEVLASKREESREYEAVLAGVDIQIRVNKLLLDSIRDWIVLAVVLGSMTRTGGDIPAAILGSALASFVRATLANIHRLDEHVGERCVVKSILNVVKATGKNRVVDRNEIAEQITAGGCAFPGCKYFSKNGCTLSAEELDALLAQMERAEILTKTGTSSYRVA